jgi:hypothetical protein
VDKEMFEEHPQLIAVLYHIIAVDELSLAAKVETRTIVVAPGYTEDEISTEVDPTSELPKSRPRCAEERLHVERPFKVGQLRLYLMHI